MEHKFFKTDFQIKEISEEGKFSGYGSVFDVIDHGRDKIVKGAFTDSLKEWKAKKKLPALLWQHDHKQPIGKYTKMVEDENGLYVEGQLALKTQRGAEAHELMKMDAVDGLSIGYALKEWTYDEDEDFYTLLKVNLWEVSLVTIPMNDEARVSDVKNILASGEIPTERQFEKFLRDVGFSKQQAKTITSNGFKNISDSGRDAQDKQEPGRDDQVKQCINNLLNLIQAATT